MSMHKQPLTDCEKVGLELHRLPVGTPSQLADAFRLGIAWAKRYEEEYKEKVDG
ncbi:hypothetical protein NVP1121O_069 [Vibrio phage 1.121.O._10N.286.46.C4]|nr:hypothetical protein NVP1121O_069 [Vibrio phage 1.121.O._10N.286.46.C4]